jgi:hypothetical protein
MLAKQVLYSLGHTSSPFCSGYFGDRVSQTVCLGWPQTMILLISASQVAKITGVSHWHLAELILWSLFSFALWFTEEVFIYMFHVCL